MDVFNTMFFNDCEASATTNGSCSLSDCARVPFS
jgi:hypothetical protein